MTGESTKASAGRALITGASAGIGRELAKAFAQRGYDLILLARNREALVALARELMANCGINASVIPADLSEPDAPARIFEALEAQGTEIDVLVNNAGVITEGEFAEIPLDDHVRLLQINVVAPTALTRLLLAGMRRRRRGRILNVASIGAFMPLPKFATYGASKAYLLSWTEALAQELGGSGVTVTALCPGLTDTPMLRGSKFGPLPEALVMSAADAAERGCEACLSGEVIAIPGFANAALASSAQWLPRSVVRGVGGALNGGVWGRLARAVVARVGAAGKSES